MQGLDYSSIIVALISGIVSALTVAVTNRRKQAEQQAVLLYRLSEMEKKLDEHNHYAERIAFLENEIIEIKTILKERVRNGNKT